MTAIWPAGPPKVCSEIANHARSARRNGTRSARGAVFGRGPALMSALCRGESQADVTTLRRAYNGSMQRARDVE